MTENGGRAPLAPSADGRDTRTGRFLPGNRAGRGNPQARRVAALRATLLRAVTREDRAAAVQALIDKAKDGDVAAIREVLDRCIGRADRAHDQADDDRKVQFIVTMPEARERLF